MFNHKTIVPLLVALSILLAFFAVPHTVYATEPSSEETFIEIDYETREETVFTLADVLPDQATYSMNSMQGETYTLGYDLPGTEDSSPSISPYKIIPNRPYEQVTNVNVVPYCKTVLIVLKFSNPDGGYTYTAGTGFMVGNKVLLTAGHVIRHTTYDRSPEEIRVFLRYDTSHSSAKNAFLTATNYYHPQSWVFSGNFYDDEGNEDYDHDWCYMVMHEDIGNTYTGWYGIGTSADAITNKAIYVTGYPDVAGKQYHQYKSNGVLNSDSDYTVEHTCSTQGGHSGAPLYTESYVVWAIHNLGPPEGVTPTENYGVRITSSLYRLLINKKEETDT